MPGRALLELGRAENLLDEKKRLKSREFDFRTSAANPSAQTTLIQLLVEPDNVSFDGLAIEDFGVCSKLILLGGLEGCGSGKVW